MLLWKLSVFVRLAFRLPANEYTLVDCWDIAEEAAEKELEWRLDNTRYYFTAPKQVVDYMLQHGAYL